MADGRKRSAAKQARRDARLRKAQRQQAAEPETPEEAPLIDEVREALDGGQPLDLLGLVSTVLAAVVPGPPASSPQSDDDVPGLDELISAFIGTRVPETTALLAVFGEFVVDDDVLRDRCRREVDARHEDLPYWLGALRSTVVSRAVRMSHVLGDGEELLLGVRLADGREIVCAVNVDHLSMSEVRDAFFVPDGIDGVLAIAEASNTDPDTTFVDLDLAEARHLLVTALDQSFAMLPVESDTWPSSRAMVRWLAGLMPLDGANVVVLQRNEIAEGELVERFFGSLVGAPFDDPEHRELLRSSIEEGTGDPLRWSDARLRQLLGEAIVFGDDVVSVAAQLDAPELLHAFVPFAHAESGIRQQLTVDALAAIDEAADGYRAAVLEEADSAERLEDGDHPG